MGQTLSEPITEKHTDSGQDERIYWASSEMQGWRITMEDAHTTLLNILKTDNKKVSFFAVFDGHGGQSTAKYAGLNLHQRVAKDESFSKADYSTALKEGFLGLDEDLKTDPTHIKEPSGCTAIACIITDDWRFVVANAGDSRAVLSNGGEAIPLSFDHKPTNVDEMKRIVGAGGFVDFGRVNGNLALSRALGDFDFKKNASLPPELQIVTADPEIIERKLLPNDEFIVMACDGIWDCMTNQQVVNHIREQIIETDGDLPKICESLMEKCLAPACDFSTLGCDNMTVVIVGLLKGETKQEWVKSIKERVEKEGYVSDSVVGPPKDAMEEVVDENY